jgi:hypothetical protein
VWILNIALHRPVHTTQSSIWLSLFTCASCCGCMWTAMSTTYCCPSMHLHQCCSWSLQHRIALYIQFVI